MDMLVPLTLEATRFVLQMYPGSFDPNPEYLYNLFYKDLGHTHIYILSSGSFYFTRESDLVNRQYVHVTVEIVREMLFIKSLET